MGSQYTGANAFPVSVLLPDDGDPENASALNVPLQGLADRTIALKAQTDYQTALNVDRWDILPSLNGTWTCPAGVFFVDVIAWGGGAGGGCGAPGTTSAPSTTAAMGGGGGGGARLTRTRIPTTPGNVFNYFVGLGGGGGGGVLAPGSGTNAGADGGDSTFGGIVVGRGAQGGCAPGSQFVPTANIFPFVPGGQSVRQAFAQGIAKSAVSMSSAQPLPSVPQSGGQGGGANFTMAASEGGASEQSYAGGQPGTAGSTISNLGGGAGGGGGAGPAGAGGIGGNGGNGSATTAASGTVGATVGPGTGAGGGGGGAGGNGTTAGNGGAGGAGSSGRITLSYRGPQAVFT